MGRAQHREHTADCAHGGALAGIVTIEAQDRAFDLSPQQLNLVFGECSAQWSDDFGNTCIGKGDGIHIAFDHDYPAVLAGGGRGAVQIVKRAPFIEQRRIGAVEIFWPVCIVIKDAPAECDHPPARILNGQHQAVAEPVIGFLILNRNAHASFDQHGFVKLRQGCFQRLLSLRSKAETEFADGCFGKASYGQIGLRLRAVF